MLADQVVSDQLEEAKYDLIDDYHAGRLGAGERRRVEAAFAPEQLSHGSALLPLAGRARRPPPRRMPTAGARSGWWLGYGLAACFALLVAVGWLLFREHRAATQPLVSTTPSATSPGNPAKSAIANTPAGQSEPDTTAVLLLAPEVARGTAIVTLPLRPSTRTILAQWVVPPDISAKRFSLAVTSRGRTVVTTPQSGTLTRIDGSKVAEFHLDPATFRGNSVHYLFLVRADDAPSEVQAEIPVVISNSPN